MSAKRFSAVVSWPRALAYAIAAVVMGVVVGELAAMLIFAGSSDRRLDEQAARSADSAPAVVAASADLERTRSGAQVPWTSQWWDAGRQRDEALVVARCEFNPSPACPQTHITGVPGAGPEHGTADEFLSDTQGQLDKAVVERDRLAPSLDATVTDDEQKLAQARDAAIASADRGFGARWLAMNAHTLASPGATVLRAMMTGLFIVLLLFPLLLRLSRAKTTEDRAHGSTRGARTGGPRGRHRDRSEAGRGARRDRDDAGRAGAGQCPAGARGADRDRSGDSIAAASRQRSRPRRMCRRNGSPRSSPSWRPNRRGEVSGQPARVDRVSCGREAHVDPGVAGRGGGGGALDASVRAADRRQRDRYHDEAAARRASGLRGDGGDPLQPQAQPPGECDVRGDR